MTPRAWPKRSLMPSAWKKGSVAQSVGDFSMILGAVKLFDGFAEVTGIRPQRGASSGSKATPLLV